MLKNFFVLEKNSIKTDKQFVSLYRGIFTKKQENSCSAKIHIKNT